MSRAGLAALLLALVAAPLYAGDQLNTALLKFKEGEFEKAHDLAAKVPEDDPDFARSRYLMGEIWLLLGDPGEAQDALLAALRKKPDSEPILTTLGRSLLAQNQDENALAFLKRAVTADKKSARANAFYGIALLRSSGGKKGGKQIAAALKLGPGDPLATQAIVLHYIRANDLAAAKKVAGGFSRKNKEHAMGPFLEGLILERQRSFDAAIKAYEKAIKRDTKFVDAHKNLAILCIAQNPGYRDKERTEKAMKHFKAYFELGGKDPAVRGIYDTLKSFLANR